MEILFDVSSETDDPIRAEYDAIPRKGEQVDLPGEDNVYTVENVIFDVEFDQVIIEFEEI
jgi:hypothetical protein